MLLIPYFPLTLAQLKHATFTLSTSASRLGTYANHKHQAKAFIEFCKHYSLQFINLKSSTICYYVTYLARRFTSAKNIRKNRQKLHFLHQIRASAVWPGSRNAPRLPSHLFTVISRCVNAHSSSHAVHPVSSSSSIVQACHLPRHGGASHEGISGFRLLQHAEAEQTHPFIITLVRPQSSHLSWGYHLHSTGLLILVVEDSAMFWQGSGTPHSGGTRSPC